MFELPLDKNSDHGSRHAGRKCAGKNGVQAETYNFFAAFGRKRAEAPNQNAEAAEIREADEIMAEKQELLTSLEARRELEEARARAYAHLLGVPRAFERAEALIAQAVSGRASGGETLAEAMRELSTEVEVTAAAKVTVDA